MSAPQPIVEPEPTEPVAHLRLVEGHLHTWQLHGIDFSDGLSVREFGCVSCDSVWFD